MNDDRVALVIDALRETMQEAGHEPGPVTAETDFLRDTPLDSLGLALLLIKLEERTEKDPFQHGFVHFRTVRQLAELYDEP